MNVNIKESQGHNKMLRGVPKYPIIYQKLWNSVKEEIYTLKYFYKETRSQEVVAHTFNPSTQEAERGRFLSLRPA